jgi:hypothetical protein
LFQGTKDKNLKANTTKVEPVSNHKLFQLLLAAISMALQARASSTLNADPKPVFSAKLHKRSESLFQKIPPQKEEPKLLAPPVLHFTQLSGWQIISLITRGRVVNYHI